MDRDWCLGFALALAACVFPLLADLAPAAEPSEAQPQSWTADNGNGTYSNPLFYEEFSDPDVIRMGDDYYLTGTTMHAMPGLPVLHSKDLVTWELASYCFDRLDLAPQFHLEGGEIYGQGIWAPCIRYHDGTFYVISNINRFGTQVFRANSPAGPWKHNRLGTTLYDLSVLFDDDGKVYAVHGVREIYLTELNADLTDVVPGTRRRIIDGGMGEGLHFYKFHGKYYIVSAMPGAHTDMVVARADSLDGPWDIERMVESESLGVPTQNALHANGRGDERTFAAVAHDPNEGGGLTVHQGGIVDTPSGQWWSIIMQDHGSVGRLSCLVPITWDKGFPLIGLPGNLRKAPNTWLKPDTGHEQNPKPPFIRNDDFESGDLNPLWQWNHAPDDSKWSLTERPGMLRLHSLPSADFWMARNTLTQRAIGPESIVTVELDAKGMRAGDVAGLALLNQPYAWIGLAKTDDGLQLRSFDQTNGDSTSAAAGTSHVWLRAECNYDTEIAILSWSKDGRVFEPVGQPFTLIYQLKTFQGIRYCLFNYNTGGGPGGYADFDSFTVDEPRASGIERAIPLGKTITLTSAADGSLLAAEGDQLVSIPAGAPDAESGAVRFRVVDRGLGRVALQSSDDRYVSAAGTAVTLRQVSNARPASAAETNLSDAETFQWVNLLRGDSMLLSLVNHRYLSVKPNHTGPATASSTGPLPDRTGGDCFRWKVVD